MSGLKISIVDADGAPMRELLAELRDDIDRRVTPVEFDVAEAPSGSKGVAVDMTTLVIGALSSGAAVALVEVLKTYVQRGRSTFVFKGPNGEASIDTADVNRASGEIQSAIRSVWGEGPGQDDAKSDHRRGE